jgi:hypothetical protein
MTPREEEKPRGRSPIGNRSGSDPGGKRSGPGRKPTHGYRGLRRALQTLTTGRLDGRSAIAQGVRRFKQEVRADLGGELTRAQETVLESAAQKLVLRDILAGFIFQQPRIVTRSRAAIPVVFHYLQVAESLTRDLDRLGLKRHKRPAKDLMEYLREKADD